MSYCVALKLRASLLKSWSLYNVYRAIKVRLLYDGAFYLHHHVCQCAALSERHSWRMISMCPGFRISAVWDLGEKNEMCILFAFSKMRVQEFDFGSVLCLWHEEIHDSIEFLSRLETFDHLYTYWPHKSCSCLCTSTSILCANVICIIFWAALQFLLACQCI